MLKKVEGVSGWSIQRVSQKGVPTELAWIPKTGSNVESVLEALFTTMDDAYTLGFEDGQDKITVECDHEEWYRRGYDDGVAGNDPEF